MRPVNALQLQCTEELAGLAVGEGLQELLVLALGGHKRLDRHDTQRLHDGQGAEGGGLAAGEGEVVWRALALGVDVDARNVVGEKVEQA